MARRWGSRATTDYYQPSSRWIQKAGDVGPKMKTSGYGQAASNQQQDLQFFLETLRAHCSDESLIKGWEADRRICVGRHRAGIRGAAKEVRQKSFKINHTTLSQESASRAFSQQEWSYVSAVRQLHEELAKAQESDFDYMLKDGLEWMEERMGLKDKIPKIVTAAVYDKVGDKLLKKFTAQRASGHRGLAIERDLRHAAHLHGLISKAFEELDDTDQSQLEYLQMVEELCDELAQEGEPDFDGKLRQAINFLQNNGERLTY